MISNDEGVTDAVKFNKVVTSVKQDADSVKVEVEGGEIYKAKAVVVCLPLAVLKREESPIKFEPALAPEIRQRFSVLGRTATEKLVLKFKDDFGELQSELKSFDERPNFIYFLKI
jgi:monoamine oxidase